jgi:hypothetical protein
VSPDAISDDVAYLHFLRALAASDPNSPRLLDAVLRKAGLSDADRAAFAGALVTSTYYTWGNFSHPDDNPFQWAIVQSAVLSAMDATQDNYAAISTDTNKKVNVTAGYRSPHRKAQISMLEPYTSQHMSGHAADFKPEIYAGVNVPKTTWDLLGDAASRAGGGNCEAYAAAVSRPQIQFSLRGDVPTYITCPPTVPCPACACERDARTQGRPSSRRR